MPHKKQDRLQPGVKFDDLMKRLMRVSTKDVEREEYKWQEEKKSGEKGKKEGYKKAR